MRKSRPNAIPDPTTLIVKIRPRKVAVIQAKSLQRWKKSFSAEGRKAWTEEQLRIFLLTILPQHRAYEASRDDVIHALTVLQQLIDGKYHRDAEDER